MSETTSTPAAGEPPLTSAAGDGMFVRRSTGLVREVSPFSATIFNIFAGAPGYALAINIFWVLAVYPGAHIVAAYWITGVLALCIALPFAFLSMTMPRSGGDYILVSRSLGPAWGVCSSSGLMFAQLLVNAFLATAFVQLGLVPGFATIGLISGHDWWVNASNTLASSHTWELLVALLLLAVILGLLAVPLRLAMRVQNAAFLLGVLGMGVGTIVMLATSTSTFSAHFNEIGGSDAYRKVLDAASKAGIAAPGTSWSNTLPAIAVTASVLIYTWWSVFYAGEIRQARTWKSLQTMTVSLGAFILLLTIPTLALFHMAGSHFVAAGNALSGTKDYPFASPPVWYGLVGIATQSTALTVFLVVTFLLWFPILMWLNLAPLVRGLFAWSFDGLLPRKMTYVHARTHIPVISLAVSAVLSVAVILWAIYSANFFTVLADGILLTTIPMLFVGASAALVPYLRPEIFRQTPLSRVRVLGMPLITWLGTAGFVSASFVCAIFLHYSGLGVHNRMATLLLFFACLPAGFLIYNIARLVQRSNGVDVTLNYQVIPPE